MNGDHVMVITIEISPLDWSSTVLLWLMCGVR